MLKRLTITDMVYGRIIPAFDESGHAALTGGAESRVNGQDA
jgi:hypothetical protein